MRVRHLNEIELQACLDRMRRSDDSSARDTELYEHLDGCLDCREELQMYVALYDELARLPVPSLPRSFARRVTFSLPSFASVSKLWRLRAYPAWGPVMLIAGAWLVLSTGWRALLIESTTFMVPKLAAVETYLSSLLSGVAAHWAVSLYGWWSRLMSELPAQDWLRSVADADPGKVALGVFAFIAILLISSLDNLYLARLLKQRMR
jgi:hypothetical protein